LQIFFEGLIDLRRENRAAIRNSSWLPAPAVYHTSVVKITSIGSRVLPLLQLTRMALVFTALADGAASVLILAEFQRRAAGAGSVWGFVDPVLVILIAGVSVGV